MPGPLAQVWLVDADDADDENVTARALAMLPVAEVDRLSRVIASRRRHRLYANVALRILAAAAVGSTPLLIRLDRDRNGKPELRGDSGLHVSLAHSGRFAAVALTTAGPIGVDVERPRAAPDLAGLARTMMSDPEYRRWLRLAGPAAVRALFRSWTYKEAVLKALGTGLAGDVRAVSTRPDADGRPVLETLPTGAGSPARWTLRDLSGECRMPAAVAVAAPGLEIRFHRTRISELIRGPDVSEALPVSRQSRPGRGVVDQTAVGRSGPR